MTRESKHRKTKTWKSRKQSTEKRTKSTIAGLSERIVTTTTVDQNGVKVETSVKKSDHDDSSTQLDQSNSPGLWSKLCAKLGKVYTVIKKVLELLRWFLELLRWFLW